MAFKKPKKLKADGFLKTSAISALTEDTFGNYINERDVSLIMFYDPKGAHSKFSKPHYIKATKMSTRENVGYAAVNCDDNRRLCDAENIKNLPFFKIYSRGRIVNEEPAIADYRKLIKILDEAPVFPPKIVNKTFSAY